MGKQEQNGAERMYRLPEKPPEMELNHYITLYKKTGDEKYLAYFLHVYEPKLNKFVSGICKKYRQAHRFTDVKLAVVEALITKLPEYDETRGVDFLAFSKLYVMDAIHELIRQCGGVFSARPSEYRTMKKVLAIFQRNRHLSRADCFREIWMQTGLSDEKIKQFISMGEHFRFPLNLDESAENDEGERLESLVQLPDLYSEPEDLVLRSMRYDDMVDEIEKLRYRDSKLLLDYLGIDCLYCGRVREPTPIANIADKHQLRDEQSVTNRFRSMCRGLCMELQKLGWE